MGSVNISSQLKKLCGHTEIDSIHYKTARERDEEKRISSRMFCRECSARMEGWFKNPGDAEMDFSLEPIKGIGKQIPWATDLRNKQVKILGPVLMTAMSEAGRGDIAALGLYRALLVFFGIKEARFWIDNSKTPIGFWHFKSDAERLVRSDDDCTRDWRKKPVKLTGQESAYTVLSVYDASLLNRIRSANPLTPTIEESPAAPSPGNPFAHGSKEDLINCIVALMSADNALDGVHSESTASS